MRGRIWATFVDICTCVFAAVLLGWLIYAVGYALITGQVLGRRGRVISFAEEPVAAGCYFLLEVLGIVIFTAGLVVFARRLWRARSLTSGPDA